MHVHARACVCGCVCVCVCVCVCFVCYYLNKPTFTFQTASDAQDINEAGLNSQHLQTLLYIEAKDANTVPTDHDVFFAPTSAFVFNGH